ncbi:hypothetical protein EVAR_74477_1 [Eumeta japonica]|uniref:Uncharacterized protein n=1 Tax=Eumeta variegata TaxID=151549 RepID=A0A4C1TEJ6_EUMVA|nr:hypothetical protein EVAR_74477_1 [Eumeta japonica]
MEEPNANKQQLNLFKYLEDKDPSEKRNAHSNRKGVKKYGREEKLIDDFPKSKEETATVIESKMKHASKIPQELFFMPTENMTAPPPQKLHPFRTSRPAVTCKAIRHTRRTAAPARAASPEVSAYTATNIRLTDRNKNRSRRGSASFVSRRAAGSRAYETCFGPNCGCGMHERSDEAVLVGPPFGRRICMSPPKRDQVSPLKSRRDDSGIYADV